mmetsp:Transcript_17857/g.30312  ORF Transcript_17857/g.30312 Transcript_17857/m.30312 type:complete len:161 (+) Transcript_17857:23-505(+)
MSSQVAEKERFIDSAEAGNQSAKVQIAWRDIFIESVPKGKSSLGKVILNGVSGSVMPGQFLSIIGASGAGKTTLLNYLSGRLISKGLKKNGDVLINGVERSQIQGFSTFTAFVQQDDIMFQTLTVRECLEFSAKLKLNGELRHKLDRVDQIIEELRLTKC